MDEFSNRPPEHVARLHISRPEHLKHPALVKCVNLRHLVFDLPDLSTLPTWVRKNKRLRTLGITSYELSA